MHSHRHRPSATPVREAAVDTAPNRSLSSFRIPGGQFKNPVSGTLCGTPEQRMSGADAATIDGDDKVQAACAARATETDHGWAPNSDSRGYCRLTNGDLMIT